MSDPVKAFIEERKQRIAANGQNEELQSAAKAFNDASTRRSIPITFPGWAGPSSSIRRI